VAFVDRVAFESKLGYIEIPSTVHNTGVSEVRWSLLTSGH